MSGPERSIQSRLFGDSTPLDEMYRRYLRLADEANQRQLMQDAQRMEEERRRLIYRVTDTPYVGDRNIGRLLARTVNQAAVTPPPDPNVQRQSGFMTLADYASPMADRLGRGLVNAIIGGDNADLQPLTATTGTVTTNNNLRQLNAAEQERWQRLRELLSQAVVLGYCNSDEVAKALVIFVPEALAFNTHGFHCWTLGNTSKGCLLDRVAGEIVPNTIAGIRLVELLRRCPHLTYYHLSVNPIRLRGKLLLEYEDSEFLNTVDYLAAHREEEF